MPGLRRLPAPYTPMGPKGPPKPPAGGGSPRWPPLKASPRPRFSACSPSFCSDLAVTSSALFASSLSSYRRGAVRYSLVGEVVRGAVRYSWL